MAVYSSTGRIYGLNQTSTFDGRRDVIESTRAAYDFLTALYNQFGSWELALAAYNAGQAVSNRRLIIMQHVVYQRIIGRSNYPLKR